MRGDRLLSSEIPIPQSGRGIHIIFYEPQRSSRIVSTRTQKIVIAPQIVKDYMDPSLRSGFQKKACGLFDSRARLDGRRRCLVAVPYGTLASTSADLGLSFPFAATADRQ